MKRLALTIGSCALLALGVFGFSDRAPDATGAPRVTQSGLGNPLGATRSIRIPSAPAERPAAEATPMDRLAQQLGTVCQTPQGSVCTVAPQPIDSRCDCQGSYGIIVR